MKKILILLLTLALANTAFSQDLQVSGEIKTGILWSQYENGLDKLDANSVPVGIGSKDDAGNGPGRFRINVDYLNHDINVGFKFRINWERWDDNNNQPVPGWAYAFGYGKFFDNQLTMSLGKLGASPWGTGGPEKYKELEAVSNTGGMRFEYEPAFLPGLNAGLVLNGFNGTREEWVKPMSLFHILEETVVGVSYTHDLFHARMAFRFDSEADGAGRGSGWINGKEGGELVYRLEERAIRNFLPGFSIWAMGWIKGIGTDKANVDAEVDWLSSWNWLFFEYVPDPFTAQIRLGYDAYTDKNVLYVKPSFYLYPMAFFKPEMSKLIKVGASFEFTKDFGNVTKDDHPDAVYREIELKPLLQVNLSPNAYAAFEYSFSREWVKWGQTYKDLGVLPLIQRQWINIRFGLTY
jgi:hypothetical protein